MPNNLSLVSQVEFNPFEYDVYLTMRQGRGSEATDAILYL